jgi:hypothetical protein
MFSQRLVKIFKKKRYQDCRQSKHKPIRLILAIEKKHIPRQRPNIKFKCIEQNTQQGRSESKQKVIPITYNIKHTREKNQHCYHRNKKPFGVIDFKIK